MGTGQFTHGRHEEAYGLDKDQRIKTLVKRPSGKTACQDIANDNTLWRVGKRQIDDTTSNQLEVMGPVAKKWRRIKENKRLGQRDFIGPNKREGPNQECLKSKSKGAQTQDADVDKLAQKIELKVHILHRFYHQNSI